jgi:hypothetical protein
MRIEILPSSLLNGEHLHCRPVKGGPIIKATIVPADYESTLTFKVAIVCPARQPGSKCALRDRPGVRGPRRCLWYRGDSLGEYQIIGPDTEKSDTGWENKQK